MNEPDKILEHEVAEELSWDLLLDSSRIVVNADYGSVTLAGVVYRSAESLPAEDDVRGATGVNEVHNELLVGRQREAIADEKIASACAAVLHSNKVGPTGSYRSM